MPGCAPCSPSDLSLCSLLASQLTAVTTNTFLSTYLSLLARPARAADADTSGGGTSTAPDAALLDASSAEGLDDSILPRVEQYAHYLADLALMEYDCLAHRPSTTAAACILLATLSCVGPLAASYAARTFASQVGAMAGEVLPCLEDLHRLVCRGAGVNRAVRDKYSRVSKLRVALLVRPPPAPLPSLFEADTSS